MNNKRLFWFEVFYNEDIVVIKDYDEKIIRELDCYYITEENRWFLINKISKDVKTDIFTEEDTRYTTSVASFIYNEGEDVEEIKKDIKFKVKEQIRNVLLEKINVIQKQVDKLN